MVCAGYGTFSHACFHIFSLNEAVAAYITSAIVIFIIGITGYFDKLLKWIPQDLAAGMMARYFISVWDWSVHCGTDSMPIDCIWHVMVFLVPKRLNTTLRA